MHRQPIKRAMSVHACVAVSAAAAAAGLGDKLHGFKDIKDFVMSLEKPRWGMQTPCFGSMILQGKVTCPAVVPACSALQAHPNPLVPVGSQLQSVMPAGVYMIRALR